MIAPITIIHYQGSAGDVLKQLKASKERLGDKKLQAENHNGSNNHTDVTLVNGNEGGTHLECLYEQISHLKYFEQYTKKSDKDRILVATIAEILKAHNDTHFMQEMEVSEIYTYIASKLASLDYLLGQPGNRVNNPFGDMSMFGVE